ncbi:MAG: hypothetical protein OEX02_04870 [Cyclobacteriaceae bacterium]|nr:hypothetical protein [Cyclobacteriaceae bacterium]
MSLTAPPKDWYIKKIARDEKGWIIFSLIICLFMFFWMILWHVYGKQNPSSITYTTTTAEFTQLHQAFSDKYKIGEDNNLPVVMPPAESDVFLLGQMWSWSPVLVLKKDEWYTFHLSSKDVVHGFSVQPINMNFMVLPTYDYTIKFKPTETGEYKIVCNEFCGIGHHMMIGKIVVVNDESELGQYGITKTN